MRDGESGGGVNHLVSEQAAVPLVWHLLGEASLLRGVDRRSGRGDFGGRRGGGGERYRRESLQGGGRGNKTWQRFQRRT